MKRRNNLGKDNIVKLVFNLAIPSMLAQLVNILYSIVDRIFIGQIPLVGDIALAGVGICGPLVTFLSSFGTLIGLGGSIIMAMMMGAKKNKEAEETLSNSFLMLIVFSAVLTVLFLLIKNKILMIFGASSTTFPYAERYLAIYTAGSFFAIMTVGLNYFITCQGFASIGMTTVVIGAITNIILDALFILKFNMGVSGAALATVIAQIISFVFALTFLLSKRPPVSIKFKNYSINTIIKIIKMGFSPFLILALDSFIIIIINSVLQKYGGEKMGDMLISCSTITQSYLLLITGPLIGLTGGTQAIISYNYGARSVYRIRSAEKCIMAFGCIMTSIMFLVTPFAAKLFVNLFTTNEELIRLSIWAIKISTLAIIPLSFEYASVDGLTALGKVKTALFLSLFRKSIYIATAFIAPYLYGAQYAFSAQPVADIISTVVALSVFLAVFNKHLEKRLHEQG